jgi:hypothetical protein
VLGCGRCCYPLSRLTIAKRKESDALCAPRCTLDAYELNDRAKVLADGATAAIVLGALGVGAGVVLYVVGKPSPPAPKGVSIGVSPWLGPGGGGALLGMRL